MFPDWCRYSLALTDLLTLGWEMSAGEADLANVEVSCFRRGKWWLGTASRSGLLTLGGGFILMDRRLCWVGELGGVWRVSEVGGILIQFCISESTKARRAWLLRVYLVKNSENREIC